MRLSRGAAAALAFCGPLALGCVSPAAFESELWPGEGRPRFEARATELRLRREPSLSSPVARVVAVTRGTEVEYDETRYRTTEPGVVTATAASKLAVRRFGEARFLSLDEYYEESEWEELTVRGGDSFDYLQKRAEGGCLLRLRAAVFEAEFCPWLEGSSVDFELTSEPTTEWWVRVTDGGTPQGWLLVDGRAVVPLAREL